MRKSRFMLCSPGGNSSPPLRNLDSAGQGSHFSGLTSQSLIVLSPLPEARVLPSGLNTTDLTESVCPLRVASSLPSTSSNLMLLLLVPKARVLPSGLNATEYTWPQGFTLRENRSLRVGMSHS